MTEPRIAVLVAIAERIARKRRAEAAEQKARLTAVTEETKAA